MVVSLDNQPDAWGFIQLRQEDLLARLAHECKQTSQKAVAARLKISPQYLSDILHGRREPSSAVAAKMGFTRVVTYVKYYGGGKP